MFRLIKIFIKAFIIVLAFIGFNAIGGEKFTEPIKSAIVGFIQEHTGNITKKIGDFSNINEEFEIDKAVNIVGYKAVVAEHKASGQKMIIIDSGNKALITKEDIKSNEIDSKLKNLSEKFKYQGTNIKDIKVTDRGEMDIYNQRVPYAKFEADVSRFPLKDISGIVASVTTSDGKEKLAISLNESKKYSQLIASEFYKDVREGN